jgi:signal transduction histidine kinase
MTRQRSMLRRLIVWQVAAMAVAWVALSAWILFQMLGYGNGDLDRRMDSFARSLAEAASAARDNPAELARRLRTTEQIFVAGVVGADTDTPRYVPVYQLWAADGRLLYASPAAPQTPLSAAGQGFSTHRSADHEFRVVAAMSTDATVRAAVGERVDQRLLSIWPMLKGIGLSQLVILAWIVAITWGAAKRGFKPLNRLAAQIARRQPGDLSPLQAEHAYAETNPIVAEINGLLAREGQRLETERSFLADAAHELRTPLAAIQAQAHVLLTTADAPARQAAAEDLQQGMERVSHLLAQLLTLARLETGTEPIAAEQVDVAELGRQRLASLSQLARTRSITLVFDAPDVLVTQVNRSGFLSILDNLVDNAIRYTLAGGRVEVQLTGNNGALGLIVRDDGPGIAESDRERVFERFVRLPPTVEQGSGLGLAIVKRVVDAQAGSLRFVEGLAGRGVGFLVRLPARQAGWIRAGDRG